MNIILIIALSLAALDSEVPPRVIVVTGASGEPEFEVRFRRWADRWQSAAETASAELVRIGSTREPGVDDREQLRRALVESSAGESPIWLVLIGHGTFDGIEAKFNLRGPDITADDLAAWLGTTTRPIAVINCASASGPFINTLSGENRIIVTATRSGDEQNYARFGEYLAEAIADPAADLDKDGQVSLLEAFLTAGSRVNEFYQTTARLATEHALIDDNGDGFGTPADWFRGVRATKRARDGATLDGVRAHQLHLILSDRERGIPPEVRERRDEIERAIADLRDRKADLEEDEYYAMLEPLALELAKLYRALDPAREERSSPSNSSP